AARDRTGLDAADAARRRRNAVPPLFLRLHPRNAGLLRQKIEQAYPGAVIAGMESPPFRPLTPEEDAAAVARINAARPDFVWVGLGAPKQEFWMARHQGAVRALMIGVGAAFDYE